jgi:hypothetical protein
VKSSDVTSHKPGVVVPALFCEDPPFYQKQISTSNDSTPHNPNTDTNTHKKTQNSHMPSMTEDLPPTLPDADAPPGTHPLFIFLDENVGPPPGQTQYTFVYLIRAAWMYSPLPPINGAQPLTRGSKVKSLDSSIIHFHTNTSIFIKAVSYTPRRSP